MEGFNHCVIEYKFEYGIQGPQHQNTGVEYLGRVLGKLTYLTMNKVENVLSC